MSTLAAVMTGKGTGAIATIALYGDNAKAILDEVFKPKNDKQDELTLGDMVGENGIVDDVLVAYLDSDYFAIHCHGNPLIAADIMRLLQAHGAEAVTAERMLAETSQADSASNTIATEAKIAIARAKTLSATQAILYQCDKGLSFAASEWLEKPDLKTVQIQAEDILQRSGEAKPLLYGARIVLAGPPNSGKSTLFNCLVGKQKAIVIEHKGTTRDWVSAECVLGKVYAELIDTAGIDEKLYSKDETIERAAQQRAKELLAGADIVLLVLDASMREQRDLTFFTEKLAGRKILTVLNKVDLPVKFDQAELPAALSNTVQISAKFATGCEDLTHNIEQILGAAHFDCRKPICFTDRHEQLLRQISTAKKKEEAVQPISELLNGPLRV